MSWPGGLPSPGGLEKSEVDSGSRPTRTGTRDSDMSDEFFGFAGSSSLKTNKEEKTRPPSAVDDPLAGGLFSVPASKPEISKANELFSDDSDIFSFSSDKKPAVVSNDKSSVDEDDLFSVGNAKEKSKTTIADPLEGKDLFSAKLQRDEDIFSSVSDEKKLEPSLVKPRSKAVEPKISSALDNGDLFSSVQKDDKSVSKTTDAKASKTDAELPPKGKVPDLDDDLFSSSSAKKEVKPDKKAEEPKADKKFSSPLEEDDDLFTVSAPVKKDLKTGVDSATKKTASPVTSKKTTPKATSILDVRTFISVLYR